MVEVQEKKFDSNFWQYKPEFGEFFRQKVQKRVEERGNQLKAADFNDMDLIHPGRHIGIDQFFETYQIPQSSKILQIGSGLGGTSRYLHTTKGVDILSIEYLPHFVQESTYVNSVLGLQDHITHNQGDVRTFPIPENEYDAAYAILVFMYIPGDEGIHNLARGLKPGGLFYLQEYYWIKSPEEFNQKDNWCYETRAMYGVRSKESYREVFEAAGLEILEEKEFGEIYSESVWNRAQSLVDAGCPVDDNMESEHSQYVICSPYLSRTFNDMTADQIREKWPGVAPWCDPETMVFGEKKLCDVWRVVARKRQK